MTTSVQEHETRCEDKWNNLLSTSKVNRTKALSDVERLEIRKTKLSRGGAEIQQWRSVRTSYINICQE